ncbi:hypothetical protein PHYPO_G00077470 [Pangasianodon hypophthalmus]|uniref:Uncharacterized protein n=1 Tax=Pangasianodon hypophthalmus TaxID=310915 RepID=A0A5N5LL16_PANHP|nr:hypothetical protein PHYPO_G00077470 [Pangasianodon hypophthalmus]
MKSSSVVLCCNEDLLADLARPETPLHFHYKLGPRSAGFFSAVCSTRKGLGACYGRLTSSRCMRLGG